MLLAKQNFSLQQRGQIDDGFKLFCAGSYPVLASPSNVNACIDGEQANCKANGISIGFIARDTKPEGCKLIHGVGNPRD